ncbi:hypothetical protein N7509_001633 [Penicillium cosmopolitanum]|uniref:Uncharacterized protein n=1 Tax=Penicillium cosmopolitanum TaxID=1131564 RepID=A0A9W9W7D5_9EURO|nr:uncharacterized protein N7509_001633 [Penicillium cosmopolitanum]KAJ5407750.1 hypothetical protein N7509_001633 [Penicillium cosmopolitanum]
MAKSRAQGASASLRWWIMAIPALPVSAYAFYFIFYTPSGNRPTRTRMLSSIHGYIHIIAGGVAMLLGPIQFVEKVRRLYPSVHRWVGRVYAAAIFASGLCGLQVSMDSNAYPIGDYGFAILAILWMATMTMGLRTIWSGDVSGHREWMIRNFALTYAAVMLRWQLALMILFYRMTLPAALTIAAYSCWIPNIIFAEWYIGMRKNRKLAVE